MFLARLSHYRRFCLKLFKRRLLSDSLFVNLWYRFLLYNLLIGIFQSSSTIIGTDYLLYIVISLFFDLLKVAFRCLSEELHVKLFLLLLLFSQHILLFIDLPKSLLCQPPLLFPMVLFMRFLQCLLLSLLLFLDNIPFFVLVCL